MTSYATPHQLWDTFTHLTSPYEREAVNTSSLRPKGHGTTRIDISISLSNNNIQNKTSVSFSKEQDKGLEKVLRQLTETYVMAVDEGFSKELPGNTETKE